ncbi:MAG: hypothetical protein PHT24_07965, partial [Endomicrobiaceae bacterium]|nr:hypothetical protein [Endomicrobiaceae bacterium]
LLGYFKSGEGIFIPKVFEISKGLCIFAVNNKWYIGDGAIWEIEQARQSGTISAEDLDGIEPVVYEYMPGFMQRAIKAKEEKNGKPGLNFGRQLKTIVTKTLSLVLISFMLLSTASCSFVKQEEEVTWPQTSSYVLSQSEREEQLRQINEELMLFSQFDAADGTAGDGKYNSFLYDEMSQANKNMLSDEDIIVLQDLRNLYDQALIALNLMENFRMEEARQVLQAITDQGYLYKSNLEERVITGEVLWVGIAARQYKLLTMGSTEFDGLIAKCDKWVTAQTTGQYLFGNSSWDWVSAEHLWDALAYLRLKLYCDDLYGQVGMSRQAATENMKLFMFSIINNMYDSETNSFYRGAFNDKYSVLDANTWGIQVLIMLKTTYPAIYNFEYEQGSAKDISIPKIFEYIENNFAKTVTINGKTYSNLYMAGTESSNPVMFEWSLQAAGSYRMAANMYAAEGNTELAEQYIAKADAIERDVKAYAADLGIEEGLPYVDTNGALIYQLYGWKGFTVPAVAPIGQPSVSFFTQIQPVIPASYQGTVDMKIKTYEDGYKEFYLFFQSYENENSQPFKDITAKLDNLGIKYFTESVRENGEKIIKLYITPTDYRLQNSGIVWPGIINDSQTPNSILPTTIPFINNLIAGGKGTIGNILFTILKKETVQSLFKPLTFKKGHTSQAGQKGAGIVIGATHISMTAAVFSTIALLLTPVMSFFAVPLLGGITLGAIAVAIAFMTGIVVNIITHAIVDFRYIKALGFEIKMNQYGRENVKFTEKGIETTGEQKTTNIKTTSKIGFSGKIKTTFVKGLLGFLAVAILFSTIATACAIGNKEDPAVTPPAITQVDPTLSPTQTQTVEPTQTQTVEPTQTQTVEPTEPTEPTDPTQTAEYKAAIDEIEKLMEDFDDKKGLVDSFYTG